jgi:tetratricopeptide (TPR) repeat protein
MSSRFLRMTLLLAPLALAACATTKVAETSNAAAATEVSTANEPAATLAVDPSWPVSVDAYRTTSGTIYLGNLDARIDELRRIVAERNLAVHRTALAGSLYHRYRVMGRVADAEEAMGLLDAAVAAEPAVAEHRQMRAVVRSGFHRFDDALADLDAAQQGGARGDVLRRTRREIRLARGDYDALGDEFARSSELTPEFDELAHRADLSFLQGDPERATLLYRAAQQQYRDVNPVPLAWLHVQQGIMLLRMGRIEEAKRFFAASHARLPQYYLATEHLAECETRLGNYDAARALYREVIAQTGNPEFVAAMARLERAAGDEAKAAALAQDAARGYDALLDRNPAAYAQHAAQFYIEFEQAERADALARQNLALRHDVGSWILQARTALAVDDLERACASRDEALATGLRPPELGEIASLDVECAR